MTKDPIYTVLPKVISKVEAALKEDKKAVVNDEESDVDEAEDNDIEVLCDYVFTPTHQLAQVMQPVLEDHCIKSSLWPDEVTDDGNEQVDNKEDRERGTAGELETAECAGKQVKTLMVKFNVSALVDVYMMAGINVIRMLCLEGTHEKKERR